MPGKKFGHVEIGGAAGPVYVKKAGDTMTGDLDMGLNKLKTSHLQFRQFSAGDYIIEEIVGGARANLRLYDLYAEGAVDCVDINADGDISVIGGIGMGESITMEAGKTVDGVDVSAQALKVRTKEVDEAAIAHNRILRYNSVTGKLEYQDVPQGFIMLADETLLAAATSVTFSGLDMEGEGPYMLIAFLKSGVAGGFNTSLYYNADETNTNYYGQALHANNATISAIRDNSATICTTVNGTGHGALINLIIMKIAGQYPRATNLAHRFSLPSSIILSNYFHVRNNTENVTSITVKAGIADGFAIGSRFILLRAGLIG